MNIKPLSLLLAILATTITSFAQPAVIEDFKPSSLNQPDQEYP
jgi:hypothetical protein